MNQDYAEFLARKAHLESSSGFEPVYMPDALFPFQAALVEWAIRKGRSAMFADCGLGKTFMQLVWAENVARHTGGRVLVLCPLAVAFQTVNEAGKFGIEATYRREGIVSGDRIVVTNYQRLHNFTPSDFVAVVCDEAGILKNFAGAIRKSITDFMAGHEYRMLCTATAAPNDYIELGTSAEALGVMDRKHMLAQFFTHDGGDTSKWRIKGHAREHLFWQWVASWARACRKPSDIGFDDGDFVLPELIQHRHVVAADTPMDGFLFDLPAIGLSEQRVDLRRTLKERCGMASELVNAHDSPAVCWTNLNSEADLIAKSVSGAVNVQGADSDDYKEDAFRDFANGGIRVIVSKPSIAGFGLNWQHCAHMTFFPSHSYEQFYQCVRRCWRFGQTKPVMADIVTTESQENVLRNMERKAAAADHMFDRLVARMNDEIRAAVVPQFQNREELPSWL